MGWGPDRRRSGPPLERHCFRDIKRVRQLGRGCRFGADSQPGVGAASGGWPSRSATTVAQRVRTGARLTRIGGGVGDMAASVSPRGRIGESLRDVAASRPCTSFKAAVAIPENRHSVSFGEEAFSVRDPKNSQACFQSVRVDDVAGRRRDQQAAFITASVGL